MLRSPLKATNPARLFSGIKILYFATIDLNSRFSKDQMKMFEITTSVKEKKVKKRPEPVPAAAATASR